MIKNKEEHDIVADYPTLKDKKSFFYTDSLKKLNDISKGNIYFTKYLPIPKIMSKNIQKANLSFMIVDTNYDLIDQILTSKEYIVRIDIQNCPIDIAEKIQKNDFTLKKWGTIIIDLEKTEDELWTNIKKETRKIIKKTSNSGCKTYLCQSDNEFKEYYMLLKKSRNQMKFQTAPYNAAYKQWKIMHPENYHVFLIRDSKNNLLAGMGILYTADYMIEVAAARSEKSKEKHIYANDLLKWEIIKWGQKNKIKYYDLAGINPNPEHGSKDEAIKKFKEKWGGQYYDWYYFEKYNVNNITRKLINNLEKIYKKK
jgi:lipid II:glycine glycyltransferase (peptidoglycan interpeptide bridge formation enzyme)